jgi:hypothetical protein
MLKESLQIARKESKKISRAMPWKENQRGQIAYMHEIFSD